jgi:hypothetical protein
MISIKVREGESTISVLMKSDQIRSYPQKPDFWTGNDFLLPQLISSSRATSDIDWSAAVRESIYTAGKNKRLLMLGIVADFERS